MVGKWAVSVLFLAFQVTGCKQRSFHEVKSQEGLGTGTSSDATDEERQKMARGLEYPYERLPHSFLLVGQEVHKISAFPGGELSEATLEVDGRTVTAKEFLAKETLEGALSKRRTAVIAYGSNAAPSALKSKFSPPKYAKTPVVPVVKATLRDFDVVFSAAVGYYGTLQAAIAHAPGAKVDVFITYLDDDELKRMHESESVGTHYEVGMLKGNGEDPLLVDEFGARIDAVRLYNDLSGAYEFQGKPVAFRSVKGERPLPAKTHPEVIADVLGKSTVAAARGWSVQDYVLNNIRWNEAAQNVSAEVKKRCLPIRLPGFTVEEGPSPGVRKCEGVQ